MLWNNLLLLIVVGWLTMNTALIAQQWTFTDITDQARVAGPSEPGRTGGHGVMFADVDNDGLPDLYITMIFQQPMPELFYRNLGAGRFVEEGILRGI